MLSISAAGTLGAIPEDDAVTNQFQKLHPFMYQKRDSELGHGII